MQNSEYRNNCGREGIFLSQSSIKSWKNFSPIAWKRKFIDNIKDDDENPAFLLGSLLDILISTPNDMDKYFFVSDIIKLPSEAECKMLKCIFQEIVSHNKQ